jgi:hypothetical protein
MAGGLVLRSRSGLHSDPSDGRIKGKRAGFLKLLFMADRFAGWAARSGLMQRPSWFAALFVVLAFAGCASLAAGPRQAPNAPYQQSDPRDTSGMH